ncbi:hypothetical protein OH784_09960 [Ectobacillus funiculus]|uniref:hypothetical protein n=1 Tax=Ectobacillus funiculus TaxID=137993 RepID=UPI00397C3802
MSQEKNFARNKGNFAKLVLSHIDNNNNTEQNVSNVNYEFAPENDAQFIDNNNVNSKTKNNNKF